MCITIDIRNESMMGDDLHSKEMEIKLSIGGSASKKKEIWNNRL